ncbi:ATP-grasp domain-containing protein [Streptomyces gobiensis]|uniref:ATP-grasp domain-containing protein n=1 Tax=Streptomyces gobiensis TaxID=2875706 RepID=UPI001E625E94|nr:ATP-grasp domain-containing protein [Streptomyces gobiensis]UGY92397.1 ATP-grasp domain-containing protein [Streptomyces gobiensis]
MTDTLSANRVLMVLPSHRLVRKAAEAGCRVWSVWDPALRDRTYLDKVAQYSEQLLLADMDDETALRALIARTAREHQVTQVMHLGGVRAMGPVLAEAEALGLGANPAHAVRLLSDRGALRELLRTHPRLRVHARRAADAAGVREAMAHFAGAPFVVKSAVASGGCDAAFIRDTHELGRWERRAAALGSCGPFVIEEYLTGPQYAVETLSVDGMHQVVGITAARTTGPPRFVTTSHVHPAPLGVRDEAAIRSAVCALLDLVAFECGPAHTEVVQTPGGPRILASRAGLGGGHIPLLVELASGTDLEEETFRALTGRVPMLASARRTAMIGFFPFSEDRSAPLSDLGGLRALPYVRAVEFPTRPGGPVPRTTGHTSHRGFVVVIGAGPEEAAEHLAAACSLLRVESETEAESEPWP